MPKPLLLAVACSLVSLAALARQQAARDKPAVDIGTRVEMFVDDWLIERRSGVDLRLNTPERREVVLVTDRPWEGSDSAYYTVLRDGARIRLYYRGYCPTDLSSQQVTCCAESADGIHFERPNLGLYTFNGSKANNIVYQGIEAHNFAPFLDTNPAAKPEERYKAFGGVEGKFFAFVSPDGLRWKKLQEQPLMTKGAFDSLNTGFWDETAKVYRCYSRCWTQGGYSGMRAIQSSVSPDFVHWSDPVPNRYPPGAPAEHFYTNATRPCPGAPHLLLSFPKRFVPDRKKWPDYKEPGVSDALLMSSRDGVNWDRTFLEAWMRPGPDPRNWTQRSNMPATGIIETGPGEYSLYISEHYGWPDNRLRRLAVRRNGFASVHAGAREGEFTTRPFTFAGLRLLLNYATSAAGSLRVEVQDADGRPVPGFTLADNLAPFFGDELDAAARWKGGEDLSSLAGRAIRLRFVLRDADLYALQTAR